MSKNSSLTNFITNVRSIYGEGFIPLHRPIFQGREREILVDVIDNNFVSSAGQQVSEFEQKIAEYTGAKYAIATVNGTAALQVAMQLAGVQRGDEVLTQALSFIATCNAISYLGAKPVFADVDLDTMGLSPAAVRQFIQTNYEFQKGSWINKTSGRRLGAIVPMHTFGHPARIEELAALCDEFDVPLVEDSAESLGSTVDKQHTGTFGLLGAFSFNGNKIITTGGGGMIVTDDEEIAQRAKHLTTTAKVPHAYEFDHDEVGYNYRLPSLNAALGIAQMERLDEMLEIKSKIAQRYRDHFANTDVNFVDAREGTHPNFWLNAICAKDKAERDLWLKETNENGVMTRPIWRLMTSLKMYSDCLHDGLENSRWLEERIVNIPSSVPEGHL